MKKNESQNLPYCTMLEVRGASYEGGKLSSLVIGYKKEEWRVEVKSLTKEEP